MQFEVTDPALIYSTEMSTEVSTEVSPVVRWSAESVESDSFTSLNRHGSWNRISLVRLLSTNPHRSIFYEVHTQLLAKTFGITTHRIHRRSRVPFHTP